MMHSRVLRIRFVPAKYSAWSEYAQLVAYDRPRIEEVMFVLAADLAAQLQLCAPRACWPRVSATATPDRDRRAQRLVQPLAHAGRKYLLTARRGAMYAHSQLPCLGRNHLNALTSQNNVRLSLATRGTTSPVLYTAATMAGATQKRDCQRRSHRHNPRVSWPPSHRPV
jgi:hypothetical protein